jgi:putative addiction module component (TIGR02574 family)
MEFEDLSAEEDLPLTDEQRDELERRIELYERNPEDVIPWEEVRARLFKDR